MLTRDDAAENRLCAWSSSCFFFLTSSFFFLIGANVNTQAHLTLGVPAGLVIRKSSQGSYCWARSADSRCLWPESVLQRLQRKGCVVFMWASGVHSLAPNDTHTNVYVASERPRRKEKKKKDKGTGLSCEGTVIPLFLIIPLSQDIRFNPAESSRLIPRQVGWYLLFHLLHLLICFPAFCLFLLWNEVSYRVFKNCAVTVSSV